MDNFTDIKKTWLTANVNTLPDAAAIVKTIKRYRVKQVIKNAGFILLILLMAAAMVRVVFVYKSNMPATRIGEACFFIAMFILLAIKAGSLKRAVTQKDYTNAGFINFLKQEQQHQIHFFKRTQIIGFSFAAIGLILYLFEAVYKDPVWMIAAYALLLIFLLAGWFILRPIAIRRKTKRLNDTIKKLEKLSKQLSNN